MSYDLMVFEPTVAPTGRKKFMRWYKQQVQWTEDHTYDDRANISLALQRWFLDMIEAFPAMNAPLALETNCEDVKCTDYCIGHHVIYAAFSWFCAEDAKEKMRSLTLKHQVGFFEVSQMDGEIIHPFIRA